MKKSTATKQPPSSLNEVKESLLTLLKAGRAMEARNACLQLVQQHPGDSKLWLYLGVAQMRLDDHNQAVAAFGKSLELEATEWEALYHLGCLMMDHRHEDQALGLFESVLLHHPGHVPSLNHLYRLYFTRGAMDKALTAAIQSVRQEPGNSDQWLLVRRAMEQVNNFPLPEGFLAFVLECAASMNRKDVGISSVTALLLFYTNPVFQQRSLLVRDHGVQGLSQLVRSPDFLSGFQEPLFLVILERTLIGSVGFELFLRSLRHAVLSELHRELPDIVLDEKGVALIEKMAEYFFRSEYLPDVTEEEKGWLDELQSKLTANCRGEYPYNLLARARLMAFGMYAPLRLLENIEKWEALTRDEAEGSAVSCLMKLTCKDLQEEVAIAQTIPSVAPIRDEVSRKVQGQYEESPYPRWDGFTPLTPVAAPLLIHRLFPYSPPVTPSIPERPDVLIAGCGTGKHSLTVGTLLPDANILSVDLSKTSLSYAIRKAHELGLEKNHVFMQGDILELGALNRTFDIIESVGVLHHMKDPMAGWRVLNSILKPGGLMRIGLYSKSARRDVIRAREDIAKEGFDETIEGIRAYRAKAMADPSCTFTASSDFYTTSSVRDLLFHRQEHQFTIPQIKQALQELGLTFLGFGTSQTIYERFDTHLPFSQEYMNLDKWAEVEEKEPYMFFAMYQFWCYKPK